ncbi:ABC transporter permease [Parasediminibacterium sp. JCM 36343]|uniref:ABC transporter permease n=1 Tax=Parasediminibacterium sp. JCM 36343 TaxID=3374279 RepID=UPI00397D9C64
MKLLTILWNSFKMAFGELKANKLRTFLSLLGVTFGIFCIIGVLATVDSLKRKVQGDIKQVGSNSIYLDKWEYGGGNNYPWWKYINRPVPKYEEVQLIKQRSFLTGNIAFLCRQSSKASYKDNILSNVGLFGTSEDFSKIQLLETQAGRYLADGEFSRGTPSVVIGNEIAIQLFSEPWYAVGKEITFNGRKMEITGVLKKQGQSLVNVFDFDNAMITSYKYFAGMYNPDKADPSILIQGKEGVATKALQDELKGVVRQLRKLSPQKDDNFSLNDISSFAEKTDSLFASINLGGWFIAGLSLIVGAFGVANIMFVTVRERTSQIGLKKAIGARRSTILIEFLIESAFLCIIGGLIGLFFVWILASVLSTILPFPIFIAPNIVILALSLCIILGILSGIIPASIAAKMDPVVAIRTK